MTDKARPITITNDAKCGIWVYDKRDTTQIATFGVKLLYRICDQQDNVMWQMEIQEGKQKTFLELTHEEFSTPQRFHTALLKHGFVFKGGAAEFNQLKELILAGVQHAEYVNILGLHKHGCYVFGNGILTTAGEFQPPDAWSMCREGETPLFLPFASHLYLKKFKQAARVVYLPRQDLGIEQWLQQHLGAYGADGILPICFTIASFFRDLAFDAVRFFPILLIHGQRGGGKSTFARSLTSWMGYPQAEVNLKSPNSAKSLPRLLAQVSNGVVWLNEFANDLPTDILSLLQAVYDGGGYLRAAKTYDNEIDSVDIQSALLLTSNVIPDNEVFLSRCVIVDFGRPTKTPEQKTAFDTLQKMEMGGLSCLAAQVLACRGEIHQHWRSTYDQIYEYFRKNIAGKIEARVMANIAVILTPSVILEKLGKVKFKAVYGKKFNLLELGRTCVLHQQSLLSSTSELTIFFEILNNGVEIRCIKPDIDFVKGKQQKRAGVLGLAIRLPRVLPFYLKEYRQLYGRYGLTKEELAGQLKQHPAFIEEEVKHFKTSSGKDCPYKALVLDYRLCQECFGVRW